MTADFQANAGILQWFFECGYTGIFDAPVDIERLQADHIPDRRRWRRQDVAYK